MAQWHAYSSYLNIFNLYFVGYVIKCFVPSLGFDAMANNRNQSFTTHDRDNDLSRRHNRARYCHGAWWFRQYCYCVDYPDEHDAHLNGLFNPGTSGKSMCWRNLPGGQSNLRYSEMKIRPIQAVPLVSSSTAATILPKVSTK